jgi:hypothetical protein
VARKEQELRDQVLDIGSHLQPGKLVKAAAENVLQSTITPGLLKTGIGLGLGLIADRVFLKKKNLFLRAAGQFFVRQLVNKFMAARLR